MDSRRCIVPLILGMWKWLNTWYKRVRRMSIWWWYSCASKVSRGWYVHYQWTSGCLSHREFNLKFDWSERPNAHPKCQMEHVIANFVAQDGWMDGFSVIIECVFQRIRLGFQISTTMGHILEYRWFEYQSQYAVVATIPVLTFTTASTTNFTTITKRIVIYLYEIIHEIYLASHIRRRKYIMKTSATTIISSLEKKRCSLLEYNEGSAFLEYSSITIAGPSSTPPVQR